MATKDVEQELETEDLTQTKRIVEAILAGWDLLTWNELLAEDIVLSLRLGTLDISRLSELRGCGGDFQAVGRMQARRVLKSLYGDLRKDLSVTTEVINGYYAIVLGKLAVRKAGHEVEYLPVVIYMALNLERRIQSMTVAIVDLQTLADTIRNEPKR